MGRNQKIILCSLIVIAAALGFFVYKKTQPQKNTEQATITSETKTGSNSQLTDEQKLLAVPPPNASADEIKQHSQLAAKLAVIGSEIEIGDCKASPLVLQVKQAATFNLKNNGSSKVTITFDNNHVTNVDPGKTTPVKATLEHGPGLYGYRCANSNTNAVSGFVLVTT